MTMLSDVFNTLYSNFPLSELMWYVSSISRFHRIQGCDELEKAAEFIRKELLDVKNFRVNLYSYSYNKRYGLHSDVVGWSVRDGFTEVFPQNKVLSSFLQAKTSIVAHSPGGDVEAEVVYVGNGLDISRYKEVAGRIVLSYGSPYLVYKIGCRFGASGFIFFRKNAYESAIPYIGLFLSRDDLKECKAPATTISKEDAMRIIDRIERGNKIRARIYVEASYRAESFAPVLEVSLGDGDSEVHLYAHMCHPAGTVNDNASGVAALIGLIHAMDRAIDRGRMHPPSTRRITFVFFPEYYGSLPYLATKQDKNTNVVFGINLDMIGEKQTLTNSTLLFIRSPELFSNPLYEALTFKMLYHAISKGGSFSSVSRTTRYRFDIVPYDSGSDHDIYLQFGVPSVMLNQWPDLFYHSNLDSIDKFDAEITRDIAVAVGTAAYAIAQKKTREAFSEKLSDTYRELVRSWVKLKSIDLREWLATPAIGDKAFYEYSAPRGVISVRTMVSRLGVEKAVEAVKDLEDRFGFHLATRYIPLLTMARPCTVNDIARHILYEYGIEVSKETIEKALSILVALGAVTKK